MTEEIKWMLEKASDQVISLVWHERRSLHKINALSIFKQLIIVEFIGWGFGSRRNPFHRLTTKPSLILWKKKGENWYENLDKFFWNEPNKRLHQSDWKEFLIELSSPFKALSTENLFTQQMSHNKDESLDSTPPLEALKLTIISLSIEMLLRQT